MSKCECACFFVTGAISNNSALFTYDTAHLLDTYYYSPRHDHTFIPVFTDPANPDDPLSDQASEICTGEGSQFCKYDRKHGEKSNKGKQK